MPNATAIINYEVGGPAVREAFRIGGCRTCFFIVEIIPCFLDSVIGELSRVLLLCELRSDDILVAMTLHSLNVVLLEKGVLISTMLNSCVLPASVNIIPRH